MNQEETLSAILDSDELPTLPVIASHIITLTTGQDTTLSDIDNLVSKDAELSAKILKVSNSAFYSLPQQISSIKQALSILGSKAVRNLVLSFSFLTMKAGRKKGHFNFEKFWNKSLAGAVAAKLILERVKGANSEEIFVCGLLQNLGELILARTFAEEYEEVLRKVKKGQVDALNAEEDAFGTFHPTIGYEVAKRWGFSDALLLPILCHHDPSLYKGGDAQIESSTKALYLSDLLISILFSDKPEEFYKRFSREANSLLGLKNKDVEDILNEVHIQIDQAGEYFGMRIKSTKSIQEILQESNIRLSLTDLDFDQMNKELVRTKVEQMSLTKELEAKNKRLASLPNMDELTEIYNHHYFLNALENETSRAIRNQIQLSLLLIDIDHFRKFNDTYGHQAGDFILKEFSRILKENIRRYDTLARYGGGKFTVILPGTNAEEALAIAEKLRETVDEAKFEKSREEYHITASFGVASVQPATIDKFETSIFISQADAALYEAKKAGRNRVVIHAAKKKWSDF